MKLWLDDVRTPPDQSWTWVRSVSAAIGVMETGTVAEASLDHDLGQNASGGHQPPGSGLVDWMAEHECWPSEAITIHSAHVGGVRYMVALIERVAPFERVSGTDRFVRRGEGPGPDARLDAQ